MFLRECAGNGRTWDKVGSAEAPSGVHLALGGPGQPYSVVWAGLRSQKFFALDSLAHFLLKSPNP